MAEEVPDWAREEPSTPEPQGSDVPDWAQEPTQAAAPGKPESDVPGVLARGATEGAMVGLPTLPIAHATGLVGAAIGAPAGPLGAGAGYIGGTVLGALGGGYLVDKLKDWALEKAGLREGTGFFSDAQKQADIEAHPYYRDVAELAGGAGPAFGVRGATKVGRLVGAALMGGLEGGRELAEGEFDPTKLAIQVLGGAAFANPNKLGKKLNAIGESAVPEKWRTPHSPTATSDNLGSAESKAPPTQDESVTATEAAPVRSETAYGKDAAPGASAQVTRGLLPDDVMATVEGHADEVSKRGQAQPDTAQPMTQEEINQKIADMTADKKTASEIAAAIPGMNHNQVRSIRDNPPAKGDNVTATETKAGGIEPAPEAITKDQTEIKNKPAEEPAAETDKTGSAQPFEVSGGSDTYQIGDGVTVKRMRQNEPVVMNDDGSFGVSTRVPSLMDMNGRGLDPSYPLAIRAAAERHATETAHENPKESGRRAQDDWLTKNGYEPELFNKQLDDAVMTRGQKAAAISQERTAAKGGRPKIDVAAKAVEELRAKGREDLAKRIEAMPEGPEKAKAAADLHTAALVNKTGGVEKPMARENVRLRGSKDNLQVDGLGVEAGTKPEAAARTKAVESNIKVVADEAHLPKPNEPKEAIVARAKAMLEAAQKGAEGPLSLGKSVAPFHEGAAGTPAQHEERMRARAAYELLNNAKKLLEGKISSQRFAADEQLLRGGMEGVRTYIDGKRVNQSIAKEQNTGTAAVEAQQNKVAEREAARPDDVMDVVEAEKAVESAEQYEQDVIARAKRMSPDDRRAAEAKAKTVVQQAKEQLKIAEDFEKRTGKETPVHTAKDVSDVEGKPVSKKTWDDMTLAERAEVLGNDENGGLDLTAIKEATKPSEDFVARTPKSDAERYGRSLSGRLHAIKQQAVEYMQQWKKAIKAMPKEVTADKVSSEGYFAREKGEINKLSPEDQARFKKYVQPILDQNEKLLGILAKFAPDKVGKFVVNHIMRIRRGYSPELDMFESGMNPDPVAGVKGLSTGNHGTMNDRVFYALEDKAKNRTVVSLDSDGYTLWNKGTGKHIKGDTFEFADGQAFKDKFGKDWTMREAMTPEIETHARFEDGQMARYYHNDLMSAILAHKQLRDAVMNLHEIDLIKHSDEFKQFATTNKKLAEKTWTTTKQPNFDGWYMDPQLAGALDDFARPGFQGMEWYRKLSQAITKTIFLNPIVHSLNVGAHWVVGRGFEWIKPSGYRNLAIDMTTAIKSVITQDPLQSKLRELGSGTVYGSIDTKDFMQTVGRGLGQAIERDQTKWGAIASKLNMNPVDLLRAVYDASSRGMWTASDIFLTHGIIERQRLHPGEAMSKSIAQVEKDIPNYRVPVTVLGTGAGARFLSQIMQDPALFAFGRYHYGVFNAYANVIKNVIGGSGEERIEAIGKMMVMGALMFAVKPLLDKAAQMVTGNKDAESHPRGPLTVPTAVMKAFSAGDSTSLVKALADTMTVAPLTSAIVTPLVTGGKGFGGKDIIEPGSVHRMLTHPASAVPRVLGQAAEYAAKSGFAPYGTAAAESRKGQGVGGAIRNQILDIGEPSPQSRKYGAQAERRDAQAFKRPSGPITGTINRMFGF